MLKTAMDYVKAVAKIIAMLSAMIGVYEIGENVASGRALEIVNMLMKKLENLSKVVEEQNAKTKNSVDVIEITVIGLLATIVLAIFIVLMVCIVKSTKSCITKSVESAQN